MYALESAIATRLQTALGAGWTVYANCTTPGDRRAMPAAVVAMVGAPVGTSASSAVTLTPQFTVQLAVHRGAGAPDAIDAAVAAVVADLHGVAPGLAGGRRWGRLELRSVTVPEFADGGLIGCQLNFVSSTGGDYAGNPEAF